MQKVEKKLNNWIAKVKTFDIIVLPIEVVFNLKSRITLGSISYRDINKKSFLIRLNLFLYKEYKNNYLEYVLKHEFGHACVMSYCQENCKPHGKEWKNIMRFLGEPNPRATTDLFKIKKSGYVWKCLCNEFILGKVKHRNFLKKIKYMDISCSKCKNKLVFTGLSKVI